MPPRASPTTIAYREVPHYLFDLDGTLVNSAPRHEEAFLATLRAELPDLAERFDYERVAGLTTEEAFRAHGVEDAATLRLLVPEKQRRYREMVAQGRVELFPDVCPLLDYLKARGKGLFVVTGGNARSAHAVLGRCRIADYFVDVIAADQGTRGKPAPDLFLLALARHGLSRAACLTVEDSRAGVLASWAAGVAAVAVHARWEDLAVQRFGHLKDLLAEIQDGHRESAG